MIDVKNLILKMKVPLQFVRSLQDCRSNFKRKGGGGGGGLKDMELFVCIGPMEVFIYIGDF